MKTYIDSEIMTNANSEFLSGYFELLVNRITHSSMSLELDLGNADDSKNAIKLKDNMKAFKKLIDIINDDKMITSDLIIDLANTINDSSEYISSGYRKIGKTIHETDISTSSPENIERDMEDLLLKYNTKWKDIDPYEREAMFHIEFIRIHPFEDGNGRTGRLLLNYNLLKQNQSPVVITDDLNEYYQSYIKNKDVKNMANLFRIQALKERDIFYQLYSEFMLEHQDYKKSN